MFINLYNFSIKLIMRVRKITKRKESIMKKRKKAPSEAEQMGGNKVDLKEWKDPKQNGI